MLVNDVSGEINGSVIVKDSKFYIDVAKFVQAYRTIVMHPNIFLREVHEREIDEEHERLSWVQFVKIMQSVDLGFDKLPSNTDLIVMYNYALQIGSLEGLSKRVATVDDVANAQKHYYNFVDDAADKAQMEYMKQHKIYQAREKESKEVDGRLARLKTFGIFSFLMMMVAVLCISGGVISFFFANPIANMLGSFAGDNARFVGGIFLIIIGVLLYVIFDRCFVKFNKNFYNLKVASEMIFKRADSSLLDEQAAKHKFEELKEDLKIVKGELADENKTYDVKANIDKIKSTNKFYKELCENEVEAKYAPDENVNSNEQIVYTTDEQEEFAPVKLTKEQEENLARVSREAITLEGRFDEEAYNAKFENSTEKEFDEEQEYVESENLKREKQTERLQENTEEAERIRREKEEADLFESIDYIKSLLGFNDSELGQRENY